MNGTSSRVTAPARRAEDWMRFVEDWRVSRLSPSQFCRKHGLSPKTFQWWRWAVTNRGGSPHRRSPLRPLKGPAKAQPSQSVTVGPAFIEVIAAPEKAVAAPPRRSSGIEVVIAGRRGDRRIHVDVEFDTATLSRVVAALEEK